MSDTTLAAAPERPAAPTYFDPHKPESQVSVTELFGAGFRDGVVEIDYMLCTRTPRQMYRRDFVYISRLLYSLERYRTIRSADAARFDEFEQKVVRKLDGVRQLIGRTLREANALIAANVQPAHHITYPRAMRYRAPIISPYAREYMEVLSDADRAYAQIEVAFLLGLIDRHKRREIETLMRKSIRAISAVVRQVRVDAVRYLDSLRSKADDAGDRSQIAQMVQQDAATLTREAQADAELQSSPSVEHDLVVIAGDALPLPVPSPRDEAVITTAASAPAAVPSAAPVEPHAE